jgi:branched-subunit amino acid aminotransferase/4-amino-4-deoxychorismate lyase
MSAADEVFVTSSLEAISSVRSIDGEALPDPIPGPITRKIRDAYVNFALDTGTPVPAAALQLRKAHG